ncbi:DUF1178 family protein [Cereibacter sphaeroides]|uniref:DUF1178 family protein n=1 Tax=Cereibacter sphaeroides TaxID=1063 RepID=UPI001F227480|nr:DUF1178 family protein [Cereibacter sphaeroides]MCE6961456.1 DUF1178 family protein [Cereibacter sphaeroides]MCE6970443.1 DUF1178 family protein [Cereibacter sphaeroides]MCE6973863.1 DUF1178 family protein [Cereibacter sphaeroides]
MIRYSLRCAAGHGFESWFQSADAYDSLTGAGRVSCPVCGSTDVSKVLMAPAVRPARKAAPEPRPLSTPTSGIEQAFQALRRQIEENSEYVGMNFAAEARKIHAGDAPERSIYGEAKLEEARRLLEDGVPVAPLPFVAQRKVN